MPEGRDAFRRLAATHTHIPVTREVLCDLMTPVAAFWRLRQGDDASFLLESVEGGEQWARYTIMGTAPRAVYTARGDVLQIRRPGQPTVEERHADPIAAVLDRYQRARPYTDPTLPRFIGGLVGALAYDAVRWVETLPDAHAGPDDPPDLLFMETRLVLVWDNLKYRASLVYLAHIDDPADADAAWADAQVALDDAAARLAGPLPPLPGPTSAAPAAVATSMSDADFGDVVEEARKFIVSGDVIQVVLSRRFDQPRGSLHPFSVYRTLRGLNPSPYMFYLELGDTTLVGASPEVLVRCTDDTVEVRPIAGTRPRGKTAEDDAALATELLADPKERAEHVMLVDLGRNDVGRIAQAGTVRVVEQMVIERYSHVMHLVSHVEGQRRAGLGPADVLRATFPAGTLSGAPKIRAMEIIDQLERSRRGFYGGAVGTVGIDGNIDLCIAIRTLAARDDVLTVQAGAGIVYDSDPVSEAEETHNKARAVLRAIDQARALQAGSGGAS